MIITIESEDIIVISNFTPFQIIELVGGVGPLGPQGPQGPQGIQGPQGEQGETGPAGAQGIQGIQGPQGNVGPAGPQGPIGLTGAQGPQGEIGPQGAVGPQGTIGPAGAPGTPGAAGEDGAPGPEGPEGPMGPQGPAGEAGTTDHHELENLDTFDDHPQYLNITRGDARYYDKTYINAAFSANSVGDRNRVNHTGTQLASTISDFNSAAVAALQTSLDGKANSSHTHHLSHILQSSATNGQVPTWDGSAWVPQTPSGGGSKPIWQDGRMVFNDILSSTTANVPLIPWSLQGSGIFVGNQAHVHTTKKARSVGVFRPSATVNSGVRFAQPTANLALSEGSYFRTVVKFINLGSSTENDTFSFTAGFNSSAAQAMGNASIMFKIVGSQIQVIYKRSSIANQATPLVAFASFGVWLDFEILYTADDAVLCTMKDLATGTVIYSETISNTNLPNFTNQGSGALCLAISECLKTTGGTADFVVYDYIGYLAG